MKCRRTLAKLLIVTFLFTFCSFSEAAAACINDSSKAPKVKVKTTEVMDGVDFIHLTYEDGTREVIADYGNGKKDIAIYNPNTKELKLNGVKVNYKHETKIEKLRAEDLEFSIDAASSHTWRYECTEYYTYFWQGVTVSAAVVAAAALLGISSSTTRSDVVNPFVKYVYGVAAPALAYVIGVTAPDYNTEANVYYDIYDELYHRYYHYCYVRDTLIAEQMYEIDHHPYE